MEAGIVVSVPRLSFHKPSIDASQRKYRRRSFSPSSQSTSSLPSPIQATPRRWKRDPSASSSPCKDGSKINFEQVKTASNTEMDGDGRSEFMLTNFDRAGGSRYDLLIQRKFRVCRDCQNYCQSISQLKWAFVDDFRRFWDNMQSSCKRYSSGKHNNTKRARETHRDAESTRICKVEVKDTSYEVEKKSKSLRGRNADRDVMKSRVDSRELVLDGKVDLGRSMRDGRGKDSNRERMSGRDKEGISEIVRHKFGHIDRDVSRKQSETYRDKNPRRARSYRQRGTRNISSVEEFVENRRGSVRVMHRHRLGGEQSDERDAHKDQYCDYDEYGVRKSRDLKEYRERLRPEEEVVVGNRYGETGKIRAGVKDHNYQCHGRESESLLENDDRVRTLDTTRVDGDGVCRKKIRDGGVRIESDDIVNDHTQENPTVGKYPVHLTGEVDVTVREMVGGDHDRRVSRVSLQELDSSHVGPNLLLGGGDVKAAGTWFSVAGVGAHNCSNIQEMHEHINKEFPDGEEVPVQGEEGCIRGKELVLRGSALDGDVRVILNNVCADKQKSPGRIECGSISVMKSTSAPSVGHNKHNSAASESILYQELKWVPDLNAEGFVIGAVAEEHSAAKLAALKAAELVNKKLGVPGFMSAEQKKKLLWGGKKSATEQEASVAAGTNRWDTVHFSDPDRQEKFHKLMGVKTECRNDSERIHDGNVCLFTEERQRELQLNLEKQFAAGLRRRDGRTVGLGL